MKSKSAALYLVVIFVLSICELCAQMPDFFGQPMAPAPAPVAAPAAPATTPPVVTLEPDQPQPYKAPVYDPAMDNHLIAPAADAQLGLFGLPIGKVEDVLVANGARKHSYAFGKYSRLVLSVYLVTVYFDRERRVGAFSVEPRPPYETVEPDARKFFFDLFLKGADLSNFQANIGSTKLEVRYEP